MFQASSALNNCLSLASTLIRQLIFSLYCLYITHNDSEYNWLLFCRPGLTFRWFGNLKITMEFHSPDFLQRWYGDLIWYCIMGKTVICPTSWHTATNMLHFCRVASLVVIRGMVDSVPAGSTSQRALPVGHDNYFTLAHVNGWLISVGSWC